MIRQFKEFLAGSVARVLRILVLTVTTHCYESATWRFLGLIPRIGAVAFGILQRVAAGEAAAVDECLVAYRGLVWSLARRSTTNLSDAEDAVQEIFIEIWRNAGRYDSTLSSESTYITMIAKRRLIDRFRRRKRLDTVSLSTETSVDMAASSLGDVVERNEEVSRVREKMHQLRRED
jgi:RNA polymerase sigma factor (sigma-70 family)